MKSFPLCRSTVGPSFTGRMWVSQELVGRDSATGGPLVVQGLLMGAMTRLFTFSESALEYNR